MVKSRSHAKMRYNINIGCWNVRTLLDIEKSNRPERRTALVTRELQRLNVDIAALSETRLSGEDQLTEEGSGYSLFWIGKPKGEYRAGGVGFAIRSALLDNIESPCVITDRIMKLRIPLSCGRYASIFSVYAPTLQSSDEDISDFYRALANSTSSVPLSDKLIILGDFNARVGKDHDTWNALGHYGIGKVNKNGLNLLEFCSVQSLVICNTLFRLKEKHKTTWTHPRSKQGHLIDFIITRQRDIADVSIVRVLRSANCDTDHRLVRGKFKLRIRKKLRMEGVKVPKRIDVSKLKDSHTLEIVNAALDSLPLDGSWDSYKECILATCSELLGFRQRKKKDWFDENDNDINKLLAMKHKLYQNVLMQEQSANSHALKLYNEHKSTLQRELRRMKNAWWSDISMEIELASGKKDLKTMYALLRQVFGPTSSSLVPLKSKDGRFVIKDRCNIIKRWHEHFQDLFFNPAEVDNSVIDGLQQLEIKHQMDSTPTLVEVDTATKQIQIGKAPVDIPIELLKTGNERIRQATFDLMVRHWGGIIPQDWINGILVILYKSKGDKSNCDNYRGITLLESVGKILARLLLNRLQKFICNDIIPESQSGFRSGRGCIDMIFTARQFQEKCIEQQMPLFQVFVDLTKAFDSVNRNALWTVLGKLGCPPTLVHMIKELHRDMKARVICNGQLSDDLAVENGVKQGDICAPTLFSIYFAVLLSHAFKDCDLGVQLVFRTTGRVFNLRRFNARSKVFQVLMRELLYADDVDFLTHTEADMQSIMDKFSASCSEFGLKISLKKTKVMYTPAPGQMYRVPEIIVDGGKLGVVESFVYLGSKLSRDGSLDNEIYARIQKASIAFGKLEKRVWSDCGITISTKLDVYRSCVLSTLLYAAETWTTHIRHIKLLERFHQNCLRRILKVKWQSHVPDTEILEKAKCLNIESMIITAQLRWTGHIVRMNDERLPKQIFYGQLAQGKRKQQKPKKRFKDSLKDNLKLVNIDIDSWEGKALNRNAWRKLIRVGRDSFFDKCLSHAKIKRDLRKGNSDSLPADVKSWICETCGRVLLSKAGYVNHLKSHQNNPAGFIVPAQPDSTSCVICGKVCKSSSGLKRHMIVHKDLPQYSDSTNTVRNLNFVCHICHRACKSAAGLRSHLGAHGRQQIQQHGNETAII